MAHQDRTQQTGSVPESMRAAFDAANASQGQFGFSDFGEQPKEGRDWKKLFLVTGLAVLSWVATYVGMLELIEANMGELPHRPQNHHRLLGRHADDHDRVAARPAVPADRLLHQDSAMRPATSSSRSSRSASASASIGKCSKSKGEGTRVAETAVGPGAGAAADGRDRASKASAEPSTACRRSRPRRPSRSARREPRARIRSPATARAASCATMTPPASRSPATSSRAASKASKTDIAAIDAEFTKIAKNDASIVDKHGTRNEFMKSAQPPPRHDRDQLQRLQGRPAAEADPQRTRRARRQDAVHRYPRQALFLPRPGPRNHDPLGGRLDRCAADAGASRRSRPSKARMRRSKPSAA